MKITLNINRIYNETERTWLQIIAILTASLSSLSCGLFIGWSSPYMPKIVEDKINYDVTEEQASYFAAFNLATAAILSPFSVPIVSLLGRKKCILLSSLPYITTWLLKAFFTNVWVLYVARSITGIGDVLTLNCVPAYIGEISSPQVRGTWGNAFMCSIFLGQFVINVLGAYLSVQQTSLLLLIAPILLLIVFPLMPDSPYSHISKGEDEEAKDSLRRLRRKYNVEEEFSAIKMAVERQLGEPSGWRDIWRIELNRKAVSIVAIMRCTFITGGTMAFASYTRYIFQNTDSPVDPSTAAIIYSAVNAFSHMVMSITANRFGRRISYLSSVLVCGVSLTVLGVYSLIRDYYPGIDLDGFHWVPLTGMIGFLVGCSIGLAAVPALLLGELLSSSIKSKGIALVGSLFSLSAFLVNNVFYYFADSTGLCGPFFLFAVCNFSAGLLAYYILPETKNKTLEDIQSGLVKSK
ncbi:unnamed protein product [Phyllotreta striolata]|uniref:Major facilitator superfamily (MFS) profile domain-containing protein n=1 Tax=Phyllotreta striolata TaxID=444603 RepID=A0A9N9TVL0_PHYSR|nr:unnamed protein product [Phyllotreta striolata]